MKNILTNLGSGTIGVIITYLVMTLILGFKNKPIIEQIKVPDIQIVDTCLSKVDTVIIEPSRKRGKKKVVKQTPPVIEKTEEETIALEALDTILWIDKYEDNHLTIIDSMWIQGYLVDHTKSIQLDTPTITQIVKDIIILDPGIKLEQVKTFQPERYNAVYGRGGITSNLHYQVGAGYKTKDDLLIEVDYTPQTEDIELNIGIPLLRWK